MFKRFYPDIYIDSAYDIDYEGLYNKGYRGIIFDIDNTLVEHGAPVTKKCSDLFDSLRAIGFDACGSRYVSKAAKPSPVNYIKAMDIMGTDRNNTFFVGDQLFTDVWGANRAGIMSVLVKPIDKHEEIQIILKRRLEWIVLFFYKRRKH